MGYSNKYSNKPFERASKISHTDIINDEKVLDAVKVKVNDLMKGRALFNA